ncbi:MOB kinase activator-like 2 isoform X1 [Hyalella azteca]|uniref:MOB kinase activator-like 2 isoform X1 n=1 Tax=Hyalella azteca TaxID=294128 RepID=A0A8B7PPI9_HYAAZ|nr:MOB kinase activator-like 2 isoform X1 [Hyalella azteca]
MPSYAPLHWPQWRDKASLDSTNIFYQQHEYRNDSWSPSEFPWDKHSIIDDRTIPWQLPSNAELSSPLAENNFTAMTRRPSKIADRSVTLDPNHLVLQSKYRPLRESPTPPKPKKKCSKNKHYVVETQVKNSFNSPYSNSNPINAASRSNNELENSLSNQLGQSLTTEQSCVDVCQLSCDPASECGRLPSHDHHLTSVSETEDRGNIARPDVSSVAQNNICVDRSAFERYYEGSVLGHQCSLPPTAGEDQPQGVCGGLGPLSLALALPGKLEGLLKLLAQSLHLVLAGFCSRKARRKERESPAAEQEHKLYLEEAVLERKIPETDLRQLVELPPGLGYHEWLASHTIDFFQHINLVYGTIAEYCTMSGCSDMSGPTTRPYLWFDEKGKKVKVAAPQYIDYVMTFTQKTINDETIFPTKFENDFPVSFESIVKKIHRLLFHVIAHLYHSHFRELVLLSLHAHLNCIFAHFTLFNERFRLIEEKETEILHDLVLALRLHPDDRKPDGKGESSASAALQEAVRHCSAECGGSGRTSPAIANTPGVDAAEPLSGAVRPEEPLSSYGAPASPSEGDAPFISPDVTDTRP